MDDKNNEPEGIVRIFQEKVRNIATPTATLSTTSNEFIQEIKSPLNLWSFLLLNVFNNNFYALWGHLTKTTNIYEIRTDHRQTPQVAVKIAQSIWTESAIEEIQSYQYSRVKNIYESINVSLNNEQLCLETAEGTRKKKMWTC